jgi:ferric-dicitrate binding protein FerR (iron transport regulator)
VKNWKKFKEKLHPAVGVFTTYRFYILMNKETYIKKWLEGTLSPEEKEAFEHSDTLASLERLEKALQRHKAPEYDSQAEFDRLAEKMQQPKAKQVRVNWFKTTLSIAAAISLLAVAYLLIFTNQHRVVETGMAEKRTVFLPDSSLVILNALSELRIDEDNWNEDRRVELQGEAFFQVAKGSDFSVITPEGTVIVQGTEFNVKDRQGYYEVICYEGRVAVESTGRHEELTKGFLFRVLNGQVVYGENDFYLFPHLLKNESAFMSVPFNQVIEELERHYNIDVRLENVADETLFTGRFTYTDLTLALQSVTLPLNLTYEIQKEQKKILIRGETP